MTKAFNEVMSYTRITECYKSGNFPNAHCLLWNQRQDVELLTTETERDIVTEEREVIARNGVPRIYL